MFRLRLFHRKIFQFMVMLFACIVMPFSAHAVNDLLLLPARPSEKAVSSLLLDIVNTGKRLVAVGERGHILYSDDNGNHWSQASVPTSLTLTAVYFPTPQKGWAVGHDGVILHTKDSGENWEKQLDGFKGNELNLNHAKNLVVKKEAELAIAQDHEKGVLTETLADLRYELEDMDYAVKKGMCCDPFMDVWFKNDQEGFAIGAYGQIFHTEDGGVTWTPWWDRIDNPDRLHLNAICPAKGALFIVGEAGTIYRSLDEGLNWKALPSPYNGSFFGVVASLSEDYVIAYGLGGNAVHSNDLGENWTHIQTGAGAALAGGTVRRDGSVVIVSYSGAVLEGNGKTGELTPKRIGRGWTGVAEASDGHLVLVGTCGVFRPDFNLTL